MPLVEIENEISLENQYIQNPCASHTTGRAGVFFRNLINTMMLSHCALSSPCYYPDDFGPYMDGKCDGKNIQFDFIIVGAGTAGCVIANRLTEIVPWSILVLEAGGDPTMSGGVPMFYMSQQLSCQDWKFKTEKDPGLFQGLLSQRSNWPAGKVLGGSSSIGRMLYTRGQPMDYDHWEKMGNPGWTYKDLLYYFEKAEDMKDPLVLSCSELNMYHGNGGYMPVNLFGSREYLIEPIKKAAKELTFDDIKDSSGPFFTGYLSQHGTVKDGERYSASRAYLTPIRDRPNLFLVKDAYVTKILFNGKRAIGVEYKWRNETKMRTVMAKKEIILTAGAINTPKILMLSGVGPSKHLSKLGIPVLADLRVGCNLQDHVSFPGAVIALNRTLKLISDLEFLDDTYQYLSRRTGTFATIKETEILGFIGLFDDAAADLQISHLVFRRQDFASLNMFAAAQNFHPEVHELYVKILKNRDILLPIPVLMKPDSRGIIQLRSRDPFAPPIIKTRYLSENRDLSRMLSGISFAEKMAETSALMFHEAELVRLNFPSCCSEEFKTDGYWLCAMSNIATSFFDYCGTAKMGPKTDKKAVVDPRLRVYCIKGLRVGDASIMPFIPSGNLMAPTIAIAEKLSDMIKQDWLTEASQTMTTTCPPSTCKTTCS